MKRIRKLVGQICFLSPLSPDDAHLYTRWLNDLETTHLLTLADSVINVEHERVLLSDLARGHNYGIVDKDSDALIGTCGFSELDPANRTAEIGIFIGDKDYRRKGYGTEAMRLLLDYGFDYLNLHNVMLRVYAFNLHAIECYQKIGFKRIGVRRQAVFRRRAYHEVLFMDILSDEFVYNR